MWSATRLMLLSQSYRHGEPVLEVMVKVNSLPDKVEFDVAAGETLLEAALRSGASWAHACGGRAMCSTCRTWILEGLDACPQRTAEEASLARRLGLADEVRLACQLRLQ